MGGLVAARVAELVAGFHHSYDNVFARKRHRLEGVCHFVQIDDFDALQLRNLVQIEVVRHNPRPDRLGEDHQSLIDADAFADHQIASGVHGIFVLGTNSEFYAMDEDEKQQVIATAVEHVRGRVPVYAGTGAESTRRLQRLETDPGEGLALVRTSASGLLVLAGEVVVLELRHGPGDLGDNRGRRPGETSFG